LVKLDKKCYEFTFTILNTDRPSHNCLDGVLEIYRLKPVTFDKSLFKQAVVDLDIKERSLSRETTTKTLIEWITVFPKEVIED